MPTKAELEVQIADLEKKNKEFRELLRDLPELVQGEGNAYAADVVSRVLAEEIGPIYPTYEVTLVVQFQRTSQPTKTDIEGWFDEQWSNDTICGLPDEVTGYDIIKAESRLVKEGI